MFLISAHRGLPTPQDVKPTAIDLFKSYGRVDNIEIYKSQTPDFYRMFNLVTNFDKMNNTDYIQYAVVCIRFFVLIFYNL